LRILLAEDNATNQMLAVTLLEKEGHSVEVADNGREALAALARATFDLILMDVQMPEMDGFETTARIRAQERSTGRHLPIIAVTAHALKGDQERCLEGGMDGYVSKPIRSSELSKAIAAAVGQAGPAARPVVVAPKSRRPASRSSTAPGRSPPSAICPSGGPDKAFLLARFGGREDRLRKIVRLFQDDSSTLLEEIRGAIASGKAERLKQSAHTLKGAAGLFGSVAVVDEAQRLETMGQANELTEAAETHRRLESELGRLRQSLGNMLQ
jgi:CheY-like chemotaxis protein/HPt (histidine-containing phosphotransfer) domain-containing protein